MNTLTITIAKTVFTFVLALFAASAVHAADQLTLKPLQAVSFEVESRHAVAYFVPETDTCKVVMTIAQAPDWSRGPQADLVATRFETAVGAGKTAQLAIATGQSVEFDCQSGAQSMLMRTLARVASSPPAK
jgi:cold shock CspA family protein